MMVNNDIFLAGEDAPGYLARPIYKKYSQKFIWGRIFSSCESYNQFFDPTHIPILHTRTHLEYPYLFRL